MAALEKMPGHPRLYRRNATYYHRAAIPKDIAGTYPKSEETFSLKTKDYREAVRLVRVAGAEVDQRFSDHRKAMSRAAQQDITPEQIRLIQDLYFQHLLEEDEEVRASGFVEYNAAKSFEEAHTLNADLASVSKDQYARGHVDEFFESEAEEVLSWSSIGITLAAGSPAWRKVARTLQEAHIRASEAIHKRFQGEIVPTPDAPSAQVPAHPKGPLLSALFAERSEEAQRTKEWSPKLQDDYRIWTDLFIELQGDRPITDYKKPDAREFKAALMGLPSNRNKKSQTIGLSTREAIEVARVHGLPTLSVSTINKALSRLQATWVWADKQLDEDVPEIFGSMKLAATKRPRDEADPFSVDQLRTIFRSPLFTGCKSQSHRTEPGHTDMSGTSWFWLPLLALWTGARLNELCQLRIDDVDQDKGIPFLHLREGDETQRMKGNKSRIVPIHPELVRLGFPVYVEAQRMSGHDRVFPTLKLDAKGYYSGRPSKDFSTFLARVGAKTRTTSFHSFRHNFKDACRHAGINQDISDILEGHALQGMAARYGDGRVPLPRLYEEVCKLKYDGLNLGHIRAFSS